MRFGTRLLKEKRKKVDSFMQSIKNKAWSVFKFF
jgi:hypothetical protein